MLRAFRSGDGTVITIIDLNAELAKLTMLRGRTPQTTRAEREGTAAQLAPYRDGAIFTGKFSGKGTWERHRNGDELVQIIDGAATLYLAHRGRAAIRYTQRRDDSDCAARNLASLRITRRRDIDDGDPATDRPSDCPRRGPADPHRGAAVGQHRGKVALSASTRNEQFESSPVIPAKAGI